jgi:D-arabinose 1-dehydrogenase-like Zn-dependent alcohol dehydrogenase
MDALTSQALCAGYRTVLIAAERAPKFFPMLMTAAGTIPAAKVLVLGAGVAGLQAMATAKRLGAIVSAYDVRASSADEVKSMGATFLDLGLDEVEGAGVCSRSCIVILLEKYDITKSLVMPVYEWNKILKYCKHNNLNSVKIESLLSGIVPGLKYNIMNKVKVGTKHYWDFKKGVLDFERN